MVITFCLPGATNAVSGGYKVIFTYANLLSQRGHEVNVFFGNKNLKGAKFLHSNKLLWSIAVRVLFGNSPRWFNLDEKVNVTYAYEGITDETVLDGDVVIATAVDTAIDVSKLSTTKGKKFYLVQDLEEWEFGKQYAYDTYKLGLHIIAVSGELYNLTKKHGAQNATCIVNGIETNHFYLSNSIQSRDKYSVAMLYHRLEGKGSRYGIEALCMLKEDYPELKATLFGTVKDPQDIPDWIHYVYKASQDELHEIYNNAAIYLCPTIYEGFGLTSAESMACGCALVTTDYAGCMDFVKSNVNALTCDVKNSRQLYENMKRLIEDEELRYYLADNAVKMASAMTWENATDELLNAIR